MRPTGPWLLLPLVLVLAVMMLLFPTVGQASELLLQTGADPVLAAPPNAFEIEIFVLVTLRGAPVSDLGTDVDAPGLDPIALPTGWTVGLAKEHAVSCPENPAGPGGPVVPTLFVNQGNGVYRIRVRPDPGFDCTWNRGIHHYVVRIESGPLKGGALGPVTIP